jgi:ribosomal protein S18 acetylase RimI-like enzyme
MDAQLIRDASEANLNHRRFQIAGMPLSAIAFLILTAVVSLLWSHYFPLEGDEIIVLWGDKVSSLSQLIHIQRAMSLTMDPFFFHGLAFVVVRIFGINPLALRLPSILGFLLMQISLFYFVRRIASERVAVFALAFPAFTGASIFWGMFRPYGLLLGLFGLAMLSWQTAVRRETHRTWTLIVLALTIAVAINTHYYGILLLLPLCAAEIVRACQSRRVDLPVLLSMGAGMAGIVFILPFLKGVAGFRNHIQNGVVTRHLITQSYNFILLGHAFFSTNINHLLAICLALLIVLVLWSCIRQMRSKTLTLPDAEFIFLITLAALPFAGFLLGRFITHAMEPRYVLGSVIGIAALLAIALAPLFRNAPIGRAVLLLLFAAFAYSGITGVIGLQRYRREALASLILSPEIKAAIMASPSKLLYTQDIDFFGFASCYETDADVRSRLALVYSRDEEMRWSHSDTSSLIVLHMKSFTPYTILPYESLATQPGDHIFVVSHGGWNWTDQAFAADHVEVTPIGHTFGSDVVSVRFPGLGPMSDSTSSRPGPRNAPIASHSGPHPTHAFLPD